MAAIQPKILTWARETAGLSLDEAAQHLGLKPARGRTGAERLEAYEAGADELPRTLLLKMTKAYRRPLLTFYLAEPPEKGDRGQDFRALPGHDPYRPEVDALVRDIKARQGLIHSMLEDEEAPTVKFVGSTNTETPVQQLANRIVELIQFSATQFRSATKAEEAFSYLRSRIEGAGVFVMLLGNLGSPHTNIPVEFFRGFALADPLAPLIVINDQDARAAWSFTALHELSHLFLGATGISGRPDANNNIEAYCNDIAGQVLMPTEEVVDFVKSSGLATPDFDGRLELVSKLAVHFRVSRSMAAFKLLRINNIKHDTWTALNTYLTNEYAQQKRVAAEKQKDTAGGPNYYTVRRHRVGQGVLGLVRRSLDYGTITYTKAGRVLGVKPGNVEPLLAPLRGAH